MKYSLCLLLTGLLPACGSQAASSSAEPGAAIAETVVEALPLQPGFFVSTDVACANASNATLLLHYPGGADGARENCSFNRIVRTGEGRYRVTQVCTDIQSGHSESSTADFDIKSPTAYSAVNTTYDWSHSARHCPQSQLPEPWRSNDISDVVQ